MAKADLSAMIGAVQATAAVEPKAVAAPPAPAEKPAPQTQATAPSARVKPAAAPRPAPTAGEGPRYLDFTRKEARLRDDQIAALATRARALQRAANPSERITDNTLIRVAVDLLLTRADELHGATEDELRRSIGL